MVAAVQSIGQENLDSAMDWDNINIEDHVDTSIANDESHVDYFTEVEQIDWNTNSIIGT